MISQPVAVNFFGDGTWADIRFRGNINIHLLGIGAVVSALAFD